MSDSVSTERFRADGTAEFGDQLPSAPVAPRAGLVFISHEKTDEALAREIRAHLEEGGLNCWMSPDDIRGPTPWPQQIEQAIGACDVLLVVVSANSGSSHHVSREVDLAVELGKPLLPVRIEDVVPTGTLNYLLRLAQWIDLFPGSIGDHAPALQGMVGSMLEQRGIAAPAPSRRRHRLRLKVPKGVWIGVGAAALVAAGIGIGISIGTDEPGNEVSSEETLSDDPSGGTTPILSEGTAIPETTAVPAAASETSSATNTGKGAITRVSVATGGTEGNDHSVHSSISADGRYIAFYSRATNLIEGDGTAPPNMDPHDVPDVFVHDVETGETIRISQVMIGERIEPGEEGSSNPEISGNGQFVVFHSGASNLDPTYGGAPVGSLYLHDRTTGTNRFIGFNPQGGQHPSESLHSVISHDGTLIAYATYPHGELPPPGVAAVPYDERGAFYSVFVHDTTNGTTVLLAEFDLALGPEVGISPPSMTPDGSLISVSGSHGGGTFIFERESGAVTELTALRSIEIDRLIPFPDGERFLFSSGTDTLVPDDINQMDDTFIYNRSTDEFTLLVESYEDRRVKPASISADGRFIALVGTVGLIIDTEDGSSTELSSSLGLVRLMLSADGKWATFSTSAPAVDGDSNGRQDVFVIQLRD